MTELEGRDGYTNEQLVAMWPWSPNQNCNRCHARHVLVTWTSDKGALCSGCLEGFRQAWPADTTTTEGTQ
jgi:hypothetical protein